MKEEATIRRLQEGYQPSANELTKGYKVTQPVDPNSLKPPANMGDAAVTPTGAPTPAPAPSKPTKASARFPLAAPDAE